MIHLRVNKCYNKIDCLTKCLLNSNLIKQKRQFCDNVNESTTNGVILSYYSVSPLKSLSSKPPVLIYHGLFGSKNNWRSLSKPIAAKTGRTVYAFDLRNHGESPHTHRDHMNLSSMAGDIKLFMNNMGYEKGCLIGHSLGGRVIMKFAATFPEMVDKLIAVDISPLNTLPQSFFTAATFTDQLSDSINGLSNDLSLSEARQKANEILKSIIPNDFMRGFFLMSLAKSESGSIQWKYNLPAIKVMLQKGHINTLNLNSFSGETLMIHGGDSEYVKVNDYNEIKKYYPNAQFDMIEGCGHYLHIEKPHDVLNSIINFINK